MKPWCGAAARAQRSDTTEERRHHDIDPEIQKLATAFKIDPALTQRLNDIMIEERSKTWEQDIARLYEILKEAHSPSAMLNLKLRDMEKGKFVGKAKCGPKVRDLCLSCGSFWSTSSPLRLRLLSLQ